MVTSYEEQFGRFERNWRRAGRMFRWRWKGWLDQPRRILVELNWRLGDEIMALPVLDAIQAQYPDDAIEVLSNYPALFEGHPFARVVAPYPSRVDRYLLLRGASRRKYRLAEYAHHAGVPLPRTRSKLHYPDWTVPGHLCLPAGDGPLVALAPGASWQSKRWLPERWVGLADGLLAREARLVVMGQSNEYSGRGTDLTGKTSVSDAARVLRAVDVLICCDSGLMHLALAAGSPVVALFGPTDPDLLIRDEPLFTAVRSTASCHGFWNHAPEVGVPGECPLGHGSCLESISVEAVQVAVDDVLGARP